MGSPMSGLKIVTWGALSTQQKQWNIYFDVGSCGANKNKNPKKKKKSKKKTESKEV